MPRPARPRPVHADRIRDVIADRIVSGQYPPGHRLLELALADEFGTSQAPVREALRMLAGLRLVDAVRNKGTWVREVTDRDIRESTVVRAALEEAAGWDAARAVAADPALAAELTAATDRMAAAAAAGDADAMLGHNTTFHRLVVAAAGNRTLKEMWDGLAMRPIGLLTYRRKGYELGIEEAEHRAIVAALSAGDGETAGRLLRDHALRFARMHAAPADGR